MNNQVNLVPFQIFILMPLLVPPIFQKKCLCIFLTLAVAESALSFGPRNKMISRQINLQIFSYGTTNLSFRTPSTTVLFLSYSTNIYKLYIKTVFKVVVHITECYIPCILRTHGFHFVTGRCRNRFIRDSSFFHAKWKYAFF